MSEKVLDPAQEIARGAKNAAATMAVCILALLPPAWAMTRGIIPLDNARLVCGSAMALSAFATQQLADEKGRGALLRTVLSALAVFAILLLLSAGLDRSRPSAVQILPYAVCAAAGNAAARLTKINKKNKTKKKRKKRYYR